MNCGVVLCLTVQVEVQYVLEVAPGLGATLGDCFGALGDNCEVGGETRELRSGM